MTSQDRPEGRVIGYVRVSTTEQKTDLQIDALKAAKCLTIFEDKITGTSWVRVGLDAALAEVGPNDRLVVWKLDRLGRSIQQILAVITELERRGASLVSLTESFDTGTEAGEIHSTILAMVAHIEHRMIVSRTRAGLQAARDRGVRLGPKPKMSADQIAEAKTLRCSGMSASKIATRYQVGRATMFRYLRAG